MRVMLRLLQHAPQSRQAGAQPADHAGRDEENDDEQTQSGESQLQVFEDGAGEQVGAQLLVGGRAEHRPQEGALPPQHHHHDHLDGHMQPEGIPGSMLPFLKKNSAPIMPGTMAEMTNAHVLARGARTPITIAASSSSRLETT